VTLAFQDYAELFIDRYLKVNWKQTWEEGARILRRDVVPAFRNRPLSSITKGDLDDLLTSINDRPALKRQAYAVLNKLFAWGVKTRGDIKISPMESMDAVPNVPARERHLTGKELASFLIAADSTPCPVRSVSVGIGRLASAPRDCGAYGLAPFEPWTRPMVDRRRPDEKQTGSRGAYQSRGS